MYTLENPCSLRNDTLKKNGLSISSKEGNIIFHEAEFFIMETDGDFDRDLAIVEKFEKELNLAKNKKIRKYWSTSIVFKGIIK